METFKTSHFNRLGKVFLHFLGNHVCHSFHLLTTSGSLIVYIKISFESALDNLYSRLGPLINEYGNIQ